MNAGRTEKQAIVLSGGGAYGAYQVGVLKGLATGQCRHSSAVPFDPDVYSGTSAGAVNAAVFLTQCDLGLPAAASFLEEFWVNHVAEAPGQCGNGVYRIRGFPFELLDSDCVFGSPLSVFANIVSDSVYLTQESVRRGIQFAGSTESLMRRTLQTIDIGVLFVTTRIREGLSQVLSLDKIRRSKKDLRVIATNFDTGELVIFNQEDVTDRYGIDVVLASAAVPGFFSPVVLNGQSYIDGQTLLNAPILRELADCDTIHLVYMDPDISAIRGERLRNSIDVFDRMVVVNNAYRINQDLETLMHINRSLELLESISGLNEQVDEYIRSYLRSGSRIADRIRASKPMYKKIAVHRYHPREDLGGVLGFMNLGQCHIAGLIQRGFVDAIEHDCVESGCILPGGSSSHFEGRDFERVAAW